MILLEKRYMDNEVRGQRSNNPEKIDNDRRSIMLSFTKQAANKYHGLTSSQRTFIDREIDDLKFNQNTIINKKVNAELDQAISYERESNEIVITDIIYQPHRQSNEYKKAQLRMDKMNHYLFSV